MIYVFAFYKQEGTKVTFAYFVQYAKTETEALEIILSHNPDCMNFPNKKSYEVTVWKFITSVFRKKIYVQPTDL